MNEADEPSPEASHWFTRFIDPHLPAMRAYALRLTREEADAQDVVQDVLLKLYQQRDRIGSVREARPWLMRVIYNQFVDLRRERGQLPGAVPAGPSDEDDEDLIARLPELAPGPEELVEQSELQYQLARALEALPAAQRRVLHLHHLEGLSLSEIARDQQISLNTLKSSLLRGRISLRALLLQNPGSARAAGSLAELRRNARNRRRRLLQSLPRRGADLPSD